MIKKYYSRSKNMNAGVSFMKPWQDIKKGLINQTPTKKLFFYVFAGFIFVAIISGFIISRRGFIYETRKKPNPLTFQRQLIGPYAYTGDVKGVMTASFSVDKTAGVVQVKREASQLQFSIPINNSSLSSTGGDFFNPADVSFVSPDKNIAAKYSLIPNGLKEEIILNKIPVENRLPIKLKTTNLKLKITADGTPVFYAPSSVIPAKAGIQSQDQYMFNFERPFVKDGAGNVSYGVKYVFPGSDNSFQTKSGNSTRQTLLGTSRTPVGWPNGLPTGDQTMMIEIDSSWLHDPKRVLPITIDPTVVHNTSSQFATGSFNRVYDAGSGSSPSLQSSYHALPNDQYTVGLWHMDEGGGQTVNDSSGNNNIGTATGTTVVSGISGNARSFDGTSDYIEVGAGGGSSLDIDSNPVTIEVWIKANALPASTYQRIVSRGTTGAYGYGVSLYGNQVNCGHNGGGNFNSSSTIATGVWYHIACITNGSDSKIYINGQLDTTNTLNVVSSSGPLVIGAAWTGAANQDYSEFFNGTIDEVRVSNIARSPAEIAADAGLNPSAVYISPLVDLGYNVTSWGNLSWTSTGVNTGDGETLTNNANLVAQWNFNSTSGATATADAGSCGTSCNLTLTNFSNTAGQDVAAGTGWTTNNRRWGAGALMYLSSASNYSTCTNVSCGGIGKLDIGTGDWSVEAWIKTSTGGATQMILSKGQSGSYSYDLAITTSNNVQWRLYQTSGTQYITALSGKTVTDGQWHYVVGTWSNATTTADVYVDGVLSGSSNTPTGSLGTTSTAPFMIGNRYDGVNYFFNGIIDSTRVYSRALTSSEILSNYNATNVTFQTRVGASTDPNDGTWQPWTPVSNETQIDSMDGPYQYNTTDTGLTNYWPMDETSGTNIADVKGGDTGTAASTNTGTGKFGSARLFNGTSDYVYTANYISAPAVFTLELWFKTNSAGGHKLIGFDNIQTGTAIGGYDRMLYVGTDGKLYFGIWDTTSEIVSSLTTVTDNKWHYAVGVFTGSNINLYLDGISQGNLNTSAALSYSGWWRMGSYTTSGSSWTNGANGYYTGSIDEVRIYNTALSAATINQHYFEGSTNPSLIHLSTDTVIKEEGTGSEKIRTGNVGTDVNTVALWHLDETSGTGAYLADSSGNGLNATPNNTTVANGIIGKAREFNGTSDFITAPAPSVPATGSWTYEMWVYLNSTNSSYILDRTTATNNLISLVLTSGQFCFQTRYDDGSGLACTQGYTPVVGQWYHIAMVRNYNSSFLLYVNGQQVASTIDSGSKSLTAPIPKFGMHATSGVGFMGKLDEIKISNIALSADTIAGDYRLGANQYINRTINSTNLSGQTSLPFYIAADRPGSYLSATVGNTAFANYQPDTNTVGLWHLEENNQTPSLPVTSGLSLWVKADGITGLSDGAAVSTWNDLSGNGRNLTQATGSKQPIYKANIINGLPVVRFTASAVQEISNATNFGTPVTVIYVGRETGGANGRVLSTNVGASNWLLGYWSGAKNQGYFGGWVTPSGTPATDTNWHTFSAVETGSLSSVYADGGLVASNANGVAGPNSIDIGCYAGTECSNADVAELLIYNSALSSTDRANVEAYLNAKYNINGGLGQSAYLKDSSGNGNNGTPVGTTLVQGKIGNARNFNGTSDYIDAGSGNSLNIGGNLTLEGWFRTTDNSNNITMISKGTDNNWLYYLGKTNTNTVTCKIYQSGSGSGYLQVTSTNTVNDGNWHYAACTLAGTTLNLYVDGILAATSNTTTGSRNTTTTGNFEIGKFNWSSGNVYWNGSLDEVRVSNIARSATDIRQAYEVGLRTHQITIDFGASLDNLNTISGSGDTSFIIDATQKGLAKKGSNLYLGDKIIVRETFSGTEYIAQGTVNSVNTDTGAVTVASWDAGSTFPASGFDSGADVFKWQREYWNIKNAATQPSLDMNAVTLLSLRFTDGNEGRTVWLDDLRDATDYMNNPAGTAITSATGYRYMQYRAVFNSVDPNVAASLSSVTVNDTLQAPPAAPSLDSPTNAATSQSPVLQLKTTATDPNSDYVRYKIAVCTDSAMTQNCQTFDQTASQTGWSGQNAQTGTAYASGTQGVYTVQYASLQPLTTYYWDSYVIDPGGSNTWSATQGSPYSFTTAHIPNKPTLDYPANQAQNISVLTPLKTTATDSLGDYLRYKIQICTDINMSVGCQTFDQTSSQAGWSGQNTQSNTAYTSGTQAVYTIQSALSTGSTYYWKSYAIDPGGTNAWSATQTTPNVFYTTTAVPPLAPTGLLVNGLTNPTNISLAATPYFSAVHNDAANLSANYYQIQVSNQPDVNGTLLWDSGQVGMATTVNGARSPNVTYAGTTLTAYGQTYYWRIRFWNTASSSSPGAWSAVNNFSIISVVSPASCLLVKNNSNTQITVNWTTRASANNNYLEKNTDGAGFSAYQTLAGATNTYADTSVSSGHTYQYRVRSKTGSDYSDWCTTATLSLAIGNIRFNGIK